MPLEVILPRVDMDMATGRISRWHVKEGDRVAKGAVLFEMETDKAAMEVDSPGDGVIRGIDAQEGQDIAVGTPVAFIYGEGEAVTAALPKGRAEPVATARPTPLKSHQADSRPTAVTPEAASGLPRATPLARRLARERGLSLSALTGSGPSGRIQAKDVIYAPAAERAPPAANRASDDAAPALFQEGSYEIVPIDGMRREIAERLVHSKRTVPHFYLEATCHIGRLIEARSALNARVSAAGGKLTVNDFLVKAMALALREVPEANVAWTEGGLLRHRASDIGVAVAVEGGLFTPIVRAAEIKSLTAISREVKDYSARAWTRRLLPAEYQGGSTTVSNLGMFGIERFAAVVNPPQATILAVGAGTQRPVVADGRLAIGTCMTCALSCDHRAVDGAVGAQLLAAFRAFIEEPALMLA